MKKFIISITTAAFLTLLIPTGTALAAPVCNLTATGDDILINFSGAVIFSNIKPQVIAQSANIPAGEYEITASTWDNHSAHGGQGQTAEKVRFQFYEGSALMLKTRATADIAENANWRTTELGSYTIPRDATQVKAVHAAVGTGNYQSVAPICIKLSPVTANQDNLTGSCTVNKSEIETGENVTFTANANGGTGSYTYSWTGTNVSGSNSKSVTTSYSTEGTKTASVKITSGSQSIDKQCSVVVEDDYTPPTNDLNVTCSVDDTRIKEGDIVEFYAQVTGGDSPYRFNWNGDIDGDDQRERVRFNQDGRYYVSVTVTDNDGRNDSASCPVVVVDEEDEREDDFDIQCRVDDRTIDEGDRVRFYVDIDGGNRPFEYDWSGDIQGEDDDEDDIRVRYTRDGRYEVEVRVEDDDGRVRRDTCPTVRVEDDDNDGDRDINIITSTTRTNPPQGQLASSLTGVYLSQVPYTGAKEVLTLIGYITAILVWSGLLVFFLRKNKVKKTQSTKINQFKEANKKSLVIE